MKPCVLVVDDDRPWRDLVVEHLRGIGCEVLEAADATSGIRMVEEAEPALVLLDWRLPDHDGLVALKRIKQLRPATVVVIQTAYESTALTVQAVKEGAFDFVRKSASMEELLVAVRRALDVVDQQRVSTQLSAERYRGLILGNNPHIRVLHDQISDAAQTNAAVLITGETGTGKELVARAIVTGSLRHARPFVILDCTTLGRELVESELFGHERGAFTGAHQRKQGRIELADGGTLFLDEIGELELPLQAKLLGVLERKEFVRVGGTVSMNVDIRIVAATNRDLPTEILAGRFRPDLYYRLHVVHMHVPPLRDRVEDIPLLAGHFLDHFAREMRKPLVGFEDEVMEQLLRYQWPGNVRELENTIQRMAIFEKSERITLPMLPREISHYADTALPPAAQPDATASPAGEVPALSLEEAEAQFRRRYIEDALQAHGGKVETTAKALNINRTHLYRLLKSFGLDHG
jgi:DNA-binding NtrC family response regulator